MKRAKCEMYDRKVRRDFRQFVERKSRTITETVNNSLRSSVSTTFTNRKYCFPGSSKTFQFLVLEYINEQVVGESIIFDEIVHL